MADICKKLAPRLGLNADEMYTIGLMHDIGKMYIPDAILKKDGALSVLEREIIDLHSYYGYVILKNNGVSSDIYVPVLYHHGFSKTKLNNMEEPITDKILKEIDLVH